MRRRSLSFALAAVALVATVFGRADARSGIPMAPAGVGLLASPNIELLVNIPDPGMTGGRFVDGYFITTISGSGFFEPNPNSGVKIYDVKDPTTPVPVGFLPLPHGENEDVDVSVSRRLALVSMDTITEGRVGSVAVSRQGPQYKTGDKLYVVSWSNPSLPELVGTLVLPEKTATGKGGPGHIANCIQDCKRYAYVAGANDGSIYVVDLLDAANPKIAAILPPSLIKAAGPGKGYRTGSIHDVNVDPYGNVWMTGIGGTAVFQVKDPLKPVPIRWIGRNENQHWNHFIHHNSLLLDKSTVLVTEEDWLQPGCGETAVPKIGPAPAIGPGEQGGFQTWKIDPRRTGEGGVKFMDQWITELEAYTAGSAPLTVVCSSHWFTFNRHKVVAVGWYNQGVRFLDVSNPRDIRQVGYWLAPATIASAAYFAPGTDDVVYVADYNRGLDVVRIVNGGRRARTTVAPIRAEWLAGDEAAGGVTFDAHPTFGYACPVLRRPDAALAR